MGGRKMVNVKVSWIASAPAELVIGYNVYQDGTKVNTDPITGLEFVIPNISAGSHSYTVSAVNVLGEGPQSDPITITVPSGLPSKVVNVTVSVSVVVSG
jgi:hypothetical protein